MTVAKSRDITLSKTEKTRMIVLNFRDYFTQTQLSNHQLLFRSNSPKLSSESPEFVILSFFLLICPGSFERSWQDAIYVRRAFF